MQGAKKPSPSGFNIPIKSEVMVSLSPPLLDLLNRLVTLKEQEDRPEFNATLEALLDDLEKLGTS